MPTTLGAFLNAKRNGRTVETIRQALEDLGYLFEFTTVYRWFTAGRTGRYPRLLHWVVLGRVLGMTTDDYAVAHHIIEVEAAKVAAEKAAADAE